MDAAHAIETAHREEWGKLVAVLARRFGDLDIAEEAAGEAFATAVAHWPQHGIPPNPAAWLTTTANRKAIDRIRRENRRDDKYREALVLHDDDPPASVGAIDDDRMRLIFTCCHPSLAMEARVAPTLRMLGGLTVGEIAAGFLITETAMARRITRAKDKIRVAGIPYRVPVAADLPGCLAGVLAVLYLVFNEGYLASSTDGGAGEVADTDTDTDADADADASADAAPIRPELTAEAIRLTRVLLALMPDDGEVAGLLALMLLTEARRVARVTPDGELVTLTEQDRRIWDRALITEGHDLVRARLASGQAPGRYQLLAAINAVHTDAPSADATDWSQIVALYDQLVGLDPSPIVALNRAVAVAELDGPSVGLALLDPLEASLDGYHPYWATRADLLRRLARHPEARTAYARAIELATNSAEAATLARRRDALDS